MICLCVLCATNGLLFLTPIAYWFSILLGQTIHLMWNFLPVIDVVTFV